jgi:HPt (histidine-containing phosphotransfer) domain-containing protein
VADLSAAVLDLVQLRSATLDDAELMREILEALIDDTSRQLPLLEAAIRDRDSNRTRRLAHYSRGACANVGAVAAAAALKDLERQATQNEFTGCSESLERLDFEINRLRSESIPQG